MFLSTLEFINIIIIIIIIAQHRFPCSLSISLYRHLSLSSITPCKSSRRHPVSALYSKMDLTYPMRIVLTATSSKSKFTSWSWHKVIKNKGSAKDACWKISLWLGHHILFVILYFKYHHHHHHHHVALVARISLTLSRHSSLSFIAQGRSSGQHPVSSHSCWMYVRAGRPAFARPCVGIHKSTSLMSSSLLLQQCPACLVRLTWIVFVIGGRWPYSWCHVGCCCQGLFRIASI